MALDRAIEHGKEHRKPYYRSGKHDRTCRPHGSCAWCRDNRLIQQLKQAAAAREQEGGTHE